MTTLFCRKVVQTVMLLSWINQISVFRCRQTKLSLQCGDYVWYKTCNYICVAVNIRLLCEQCFINLCFYFFRFSVWVTELINFFIHSYNIFLTWLSLFSLSIYLSVYLVCFSSSLYLCINIVRISLLVQRQVKVCLYR